MTNRSSEKLRSAKRLSGAKQLVASFALVVSVCLVSAILFYANAAIVWTLLTPLKQSLPATNESEQIIQVLMLIVPVALIILQFRVYDLVVDRTRFKRG